MTASQETPKKTLTDSQAIRQKVFETVSESNKKLTYGELEKRLSQKFAVHKKVLKTAISELVADRQLAYTYNFGCSFLEKSFNKPTRISKRVVLKPPGMRYTPKSDEVVIDISQGASFGSGEHPTTRLAVRGIESALSGKDCLVKTNHSRALDIGTGSGILAIAAVGLGIKTSLAIDIDPCSRSEAKKNIRLNHMEDRIRILDRDIENINEKFSLITANLRYPTLKRLCSLISKITEQPGIVVVSGIKTDEVTDILESYTRKGFRCTWKAVEKEWAGMVFVR
ncbi:MAG: ribosomal protein L11 methyltransferase [Desulfobacteraceae bacterium Eth-SRB2]|nr:MAG: ribosomal protein L11 methyltransferase [Desulfobacteraceae bacterium Eth-SRB2]